MTLTRGSRPGQHALPLLPTSHSPGHVTQRVVVYVRHVAEREGLLGVVQEHRVFRRHGEHQAVGQAHQLRGRLRRGSACSGGTGQEGADASKCPPKALSGPINDVTVRKASSKEDHPRTGEDTVS